MSGLGEQVRNEGFCLLRLCSSLDDFIRLGKAKKTYLPETEKFLSYIAESLGSIKKFVWEIVDNPPSKPLMKSKLRGFKDIKNIVSLLYIYTKQAIDADTLSIPFALTTLLNRISRKIQKSDKVSLVVLSGSNLMYYKYNLGQLRNLSSSLSIEVTRDYPVFLEDTGILMFPYCAAREVLVNCNLFHELGHYIYENTKLNKLFFDKIKLDLWHFFEAKKKTNKLDLAKLWKGTLLYVSGLLLQWADEIFADIFAIRTLGPAYHLALLELGQMLPTNIDNVKNFSATHPADDYRFKVHAKWLSKDWDDTIKKRVPDVFHKLKACQGLEVKDNIFKINCKPPLDGKDDLEKKLHIWMFKEFEEMVIKVEKELSAKLKNFENPINDFKKNDSLVTACLEHGIVPSTVYDNKQRRHPNPTTILNSGFFFYLGGMNTLLENVASEDSDIEKRINYEKRLNQWLAKAIEDWQLLLEEGKL